MTGIECFVCDQLATYPDPPERGALYALCSTCWVIVGQLGVSYRTQSVIPAPQLCPPTCCAGRSPQIERCKCVVHYCHLNPIQMSALLEIAKDEGDRHGGD